MAELDLNMIQKGITKLGWSKKVTASRYHALQNVLFGDAPSLSVDANSGVLLYDFDRAGAEPLSTEAILGTDPNGVNFGSKYATNVLRTAYYNDKDMISCTNEEFGQVLLKLSNNVDIVLVDLNNSIYEKACSDVIYLLEPSTIKVNKLVVKNREVLKTLGGKKVVLNQSLLTPKDIAEFEMEAGIKTFYSIPPLNDRVPSIAIDNFLIRLGFLKQKLENDEIIKEVIKSLDDDVLKDKLSKLL